MIKKIILIIFVVGLIGLIGYGIYTEDVVSSRHLDIDRTLIPYQGYNFYLHHGHKDINELNVDILEFDFNNAYVIFRPSGTEPKLKVYYSMCGETREIATEKLENIRAILKKEIEG